MVNRRSPRAPGKRPKRKPPSPTERDYQLLTQALADAEGLLPVLGRLLPEPSGMGPATGTIGRHAPESSEPWQEEAAHAYWAIYFGARKLADHLRRIAGLPQRSWGYGETSIALAMIAGLASSVPAQDLAEAREEAERWVHRAQTIRDIDQAESWQPVPRRPGNKPPACPYCKTLSLRMSKAREEVRCFYPGCTDLDDNPTRARMQLGRLTGTGTLVFGDGTVVAYREEHEETQA